MVSIYEPFAYSNAYSSNVFMQVLENISALSVAAHNDYAGPNNLTIGATSNIMIDAMQGVQMYFNTSNSFNMYTTDAFGSNISQILSIGFSNNVTTIDSTNLAINGVPIFQAMQGIFLDSNGYQYFGTSNAQGFVLDGNIVGYQNLAVAGNIFGSTFNIFTLHPNTTKTSNLTMVGYSFFINSYNQLELIRTDRLQNGSNTTNKMTRVMTFGNNEFANQLKDNPDDYVVMQQFQTSIPATASATFNLHNSTAAPILSPYSSNTATFASNAYVTLSNHLYPMSQYAINAAIITSNAFFDKVFVKECDTFRYCRRTCSCQSCPCSCDCHFETRIALSNFVTQPGNYIFTSSMVYASCCPDKTAIVKYTMSNMNGGDQSIHEPVTSNNTGPCKDNVHTVYDIIYLPYGSNIIKLDVAADDTVMFKYTVMGIQFSHL